MFGGIYIGNGLVRIEFITIGAVIHQVTVRLGDHFSVPGYTDFSVNQGFLTPFNRGLNLIPGQHQTHRPARLPGYGNSQQHKIITPP